MIRGSNDEGLALDQHHDRVKVAAGLVEVTLNCGGLVLFCTILCTVACGSTNNQLRIMIQ